MKFTEPETRQFVAYTPPQRMEGPDGEAITAGSQTFVQYYRGIKVSKVLIGGYHANKGKRTVDPSEAKTVRVEFDPESIGLDHMIAGNIAPSDPAVQILQEALDNDEAVNVAIESIRVHKNRETKEIISPLPPIHALMGATTPGGKADMGKAGQSTSKVIAAVNGETTVDCRSDATQWASLSNNRAGTLPPEGFKLLASKEDWTEYAVIVPIDGGDKSNSGNVDIQQLAEIIIQHLDERMAVDSGRYIKTPQVDEIAEGKPYSVTTMHDGVNLGSFLSSKFRYIHEWAFDYLKGTMQSIPEDSRVMELVDIVIKIADAAQVKAYGGDFKVDQRATSHTEACRWTQWIISNREQYLDPDDAEWFSRVVEQVSEKMIAGGERVARDVLNRDTIAPQSKRYQYAKSPSSPQSPAPAKEDEIPSAENNDKMVMLNRCLAKVKEQWDDADALRKIYAYGNSLGILSAPVASSGDGDVTFDRSSSVRLGNVIISRGKELASKVKPVQESAIQNEPPVMPEPDPEPEPAPVDASEPVDEDDFASMLGATDADNDWVTRLGEIRNSADAAELWNQAQAFMNESVDFRGENMKLSEAFRAIGTEMQEAQDMAEQVSEAKTIASLNSIRTAAKRAGLLDYEVEDGFSDNPLKLSEIITARRSEISSKKSSK